jgi:hypothetical protein
MPYTGSQDSVALVGPVAVQVGAPATCVETPLEAAVSALP